jgi:hypothetical protein
MSLKRVASHYEASASATGCGSSDALREANGAALCMALAAPGDRDLTAALQTGPAADKVARHPPPKRISIARERTLAEAVDLTRDPVRAAVLCSDGSLNSRLSRGPSPPTPSTPWNSRQHASRLSVWGGSRRNARSRQLRPVRKSLPRSLERPTGPPTKGRPAPMLPSRLLLSGRCSG